MGRNILRGLAILAVLAIGPVRPAAAQAEAGTLVVHLVDDTGTAITSPRGCVTFFLADHPKLGGCDGMADFDADSRAGIVEIRSVLVGEWFVGVETPPSGYHWIEDFHRGYRVTEGSKTLVVLILEKTDATIRNTTDQTTTDDTAGCDPVELYPGYPGYQGYVTGVDGIGDHACLNDLKAASPSFDRSREDAANLAAADRIGLHGGPGDWTWENWMAIEGERGLPPTCYFCAFAGADTRPEPMGTSVDPDDPRLVLGTYGTTVAVNRYVTEYHNPSLTNLIPYDHVLRAMAYLVAPPGTTLECPGARQHGRRVSGVVAEHVLRS